MQLKKGDENSTVKKWQKFLKLRVDNDLEENGIFDTQTEEATKKWQIKNYLAETGELNETSYEKAKKLGFKTKTTFFPTLFDNLPNLAYICIALIVVVVIGFLLYGSVIGGNAANDENMRGTITFLVALITVAIAMILTLSAVLITDVEELKDRFSFGKEILIIFIGVLGTIIGFYFGTAEKSENIVQLEIAEPQNIQILENGNETYTIFSFIKGGKAPYKYKIEFKNNNNIEDVEGTSKTGLIKEALELPAIQQDTTIDYSITVVDSDSKSSELPKEKSPDIELKVKDLTTKELPDDASKDLDSTQPTGDSPVKQ